MKDRKTVDRFLELRAQEKSLRTIEREIGIDRRTLTRWDGKFKEELEKRQAIELEALRENYWLTTKARVERFGDQLQRVTEELENRDLSTVPTHKLVDLAIKLDSKLQDAAPASSVPSDAALAARGAVRLLINSLDGSHGRTRRLNGEDKTDVGEGQIKAVDLVKFQIAVLKRYDAGDIDERTATAEIGMLNSIIKGIDIADLQSRLEQLEALNKKPELTDEEEADRMRKIVVEEMGPDIEAQEKAARVLLRIAKLQS
jgi:hypothetical protein